MLASWISAEATELLFQSREYAPWAMFPLSLHRMLLAAVNPYFRAMFVSSFKESQDGEVLMQDMAPSTVQTILQYLYTEKISVTSETAQAVFIAASRLQILPLLEICSR